MGVLTEHRVAVPFRAPVAGMGVVNAVLFEGPSGWGEWSAPPPGYAADPARGRRAAEEAAYGGWPPAVRDRVPVNALVPAVDPATAASLAAEAVAAGARCVKVKVGDLSGGGRVAAVRDAAGPGVLLRLDANRAWDVETAASFLGRLAGHDIELVEDPVPTIEDLARVRRRLPMPVAADECVRSVDDARRLRALDAADAVVVKVQPLGGVAAALEVAEAAGVPAIVSSLYETSVGVAAGLALAASLPELPYACGLGTAALLAGDVVADPLVPVNGELAVRRPVPDPSLVARYAR
ncbi:MAG TPA: enolase C-terminal domain-like protein [Acidimicrobiales bacterium]|nr:enolase C-terminal domain-like protein [Acidimicrobiales bacterium]